VAGVEYILNNTDVRNIVVETNGLADPASVSCWVMCRQSSSSGLMRSWR
jgi:hypothetical protein